MLWVNVPVSLIAFALSPRLIAESRAESETRAFDVAGAVTVTAALSILVYALVDANSAGWGSSQTIGLLALSVALLAAFVAIELRARKPLVPFSIFRIRTLTGANVVGLLVGASLFSMFFFISLYMQQVLGYSAIHAGLSYLPLALVIMASAGIASQLVTKLGYKPVLAADQPPKTPRNPPPSSFSPPLLRPPLPPPPLPAILLFPPPRPRLFLPRQKEPPRSPPSRKRGGFMGGCPKFPTKGGAPGPPRPLPFPPLFPQKIPHPQPPPQASRPPPPRRGRHFPPSTSTPLFSC